MANLNAADGAAAADDDDEDEVVVSSSYMNWTADEDACLLS